MVPLLGLLMTQPLSGDGEPEEAVRREEDLLPSLGRSDLIDSKNQVPAETPSDGPPKDPTTSDEAVEKPEREGVGAGLLPQIKIGDGPGSVEGVVVDNEGKAVPGAVVTFPDQDGVQIQSGPDGTFRVTGAPATDITVELLKGGYLPKVDTVEVLEDGVTKVSFPLEPDPDDMVEPDGTVDPEESGPGILPGIKIGDGPGTIEAVVFDKDGNGIAGVIVTFPDQGGSQTQTGPDGSFRVTGAPATGITVQYLKLGYQPKVDAIQVREEGVTKVNVSLEIQPVELADGEYLLDSEEIILEPVEETEQGPGAIENIGPGLAGGGLSKEFLSKSGASDAAGAVGKISGANVVGGKFVVVRGLGDRYNNTTLNGGIVPSPETSRKAVQLDLFPSSALEGVAIQKVGAPDLPADWVGGLVQLQTLTESEEDFLSIKIGTTFDQITQRNGEFFTVRGLDPTSDLKYSNPVPIPPFNTRASGPEAQQARQLFYDNISFVPLESDPELDRNISAVFSKKWDLSGNSTFSLIGSMGRNNQQRFREFEQSRFQNAIPLKQGTNPNDLNQRFADLSTLREQQGLTLFDGLVGNFIQDNYRQTEELSLLLSGKLTIGENIDLNGSFFNFRSGNSTYSLIDNGVTQLSDFDLDAEADALARGEVYLDEFEANSYRQIYELVYRELEFGQLGGAYRLDDWREGAVINWNAYHSETSESSPRSYELKGYFITERDNNVDPLSGISIPNPANLANPNSSTLIQYETIDESRQYKVDGILPIIERSENRRLDLIAGFGHYRRDRASNTDVAIIANGGGLNSPESGINASDRLLNDEEVGLPNSVDTASGFIPGTASLGVTPEYIGRNEIESFYFGLESDWDQWFARGGVRFEEDIRAFTVPGRRGSQTEISDDFYPSFELGRYFGIEREFKLNLNYSESVVRPTFYEFIPAQILDLSNQRIFIGNRDIREARSQNFDLGLGWTRGDNYAGFNLFYKIINDPIFTINDPSGIADRTFVNLGETEVSGLEIEGSYDLGSGFSVTGNISFIETTAQPGVVTINRQDFLGQIDQLEGQPNLLGNLILSWESEEYGLSTNLIYNYTGEYLTLASLGFVGDPDSALPNEVRQPFHSLDWNISKKWQTDLADYSLKFQIRNILDSDVEVVYDGLASSIAPAEAISPGREFGLSFEAKF